MARGATQRGGRPTLQPAELSRSVLTGEWHRRYVGIPFAEFDCWQLVRRVRQQVFGDELPIYTYAAGDPDALDALIRRERRSWRCIARPRAQDPFRLDGSVESGDVILFRSGILNGFRAPVLKHMGVVVVPDWMLHTLVGLESCAQRYSGCMWSRMIDGVYRPRHCA